MEGRNAGRDVYRKLIRYIRDGVRNRYQCNAHPKHSNPQKQERPPPPKQQILRWWSGSPVQSDFMQLALWAAVENKVTVSTEAAIENK